MGCESAAEVVEKQGDRMVFLRNTGSSAMSDIAGDSSPVKLSELRGPMGTGFNSDDGVRTGMALHPADASIKML